MSTNSINCLVCQVEYLSKSEWLSHLATIEHQVLATKEFLEQWNTGTGIRDSCLVVFSSFPLTFSFNGETGGAERVVRHFSKDTTTFVTDFVCSSDGSRTGILRFESKEKTLESMSSLDDSKTALVDNEMIQVKLASEMLELEWSTILPIHDKNIPDNTIATTSNEIAVIERKPTQETCSIDNQIPEIFTPPFKIRFRWNRNRAVQILASVARQRKWDAPEYKWHQLPGENEVRYQSSVVLNGVEYKPTSSKHGSKTQLSSYPNAAIFCLQKLISEDCLKQSGNVRDSAQVKNDSSGRKEEEKKTALKSADGNQQEEENHSLSKKLKVDGSGPTVGNKIPGTSFIPFRIKWKHAVSEVEKFARERKWKTPVYRCQQLTKKDKVRYRSCVVINGVEHMPRKNKIGRKTQEEANQQAAVFYLKWVAPYLTEEDRLKQPGNVSTLALLMQNSSNRKGDEESKKRALDCEDGNQQKKEDHQLSKTGNPCGEKTLEIMSSLDDSKEVLVDNESIQVELADEMLELECDKQSAILPIDDKNIPDNGTERARNEIIATIERRSSQETFNNDNQIPGISSSPLNITCERAVSELEKIAREQKWGTPVYEYEEFTKKSRVRHRSCVVLNGVEYKPTRNSMGSATKEQAKIKTAMFCLRKLVSENCLKQPGNVSDSAQVNDDSSCRKEDEKSNKRAVGYGDGNQQEEENHSLSKKLKADESGPTVDNQILEPYPLKITLKNAVTALEKYTYERNWDTPVYSCDRVGKNNKVEFRSCVIINRVRQKASKSKTGQKTPEQAKQKAAMDYLKKVVPSLRWDCLKSSWNATLSAPVKHDDSSNTKEEEKLEERGWDVDWEDWEEEEDHPLSKKIKADESGPTVDNQISEPSPLKITLKNAVTALEKYTYERNWDTPVYSCDRVGKKNKVGFRSCVIINRVRQKASKSKTGQKTPEQAKQKAAMDYLKKVVPSLRWDCLKSTWNATLSAPVKHDDCSNTKGEEKLEERGWDVDWEDWEEEEDHQLSEKVNVDGNGPTVSPKAQTSHAASSSISSELETPSIAAATIEHNSPLNDIIPDPTFSSFPESLLYELWCVQKTVFIPDEECILALDLVNTLKGLFLLTDSTAEVAMFRNWHLKLRTYNYLEKSNELLIYVYSTKSPAYFPQSFTWLTDATVRGVFSLAESKMHFKVLQDPTISTSDAAKGYSPIGWKVEFKNNLTFRLVTLKHFFPEVQICRLVEYMFTFDSRCYPLLTLAFYWTMTNSVTVGEFNFSEDAHSSLSEPLTLEWLVITFLCHKEIIPTPREIQKRPHDILREPLFGIDIGFHADPEFLKEWTFKKSADLGEQSRMNEAELFQDFLQFCGETLGNNNCILNTRDGEVINVDKFLTCEPNQESTLSWQTKMTKEEVEQLRSLLVDSIHADCALESSSTSKPIPQDIKLYMLHPFNFTWKFSMSKDIAGILKLMGYSGRQLKEYLTIGGNNGPEAAKKRFGTLANVLKV